MDLFIGGTPYVYDDTMNSLAPSIKQFEKDMIGSQQ
jgi:hypothetical protein